jgi:hypothetical protein
MKAIKCYAWAETQNNDVCTRWDERTMLPVGFVVCAGPRMLTWLDIKWQVQVRRLEDAEGRPRFKLVKPPGRCRVVITDVGSFHVEALP